MAYADAFVYDPQRHKGFVKAMRYPVGSSASVIGKTPVPALTLSKEQEALLRLGLGAFNMDFRVRWCHCRFTRWKSGKSVLIVSLFGHNLW